MVSVNVHRGPYLWRRLFLGCLTMRRLLLLLAFLFSSSAFAGDFVFYTPYGVNFSNANDACSYIVGQLQSAGLDRTYDGSYSLTSNQYFCHGTRDGASANIGSDFWTGDSCTPPLTPNADGSGCSNNASHDDGELCQDQSGARGPDDPMIWSKKSGKCVLYSESDDSATCKYLAGKGGSGTSYTVAGTWSEGTPTAPPVFTSGGLSCEVATVSTTECVTDVKGNVSCSVIGKLTGNVNNKTDVKDAKDAACVNGVCPPPEAQTKNEEKPCVYSGGADSQSCTSETSTDKDGTQQCGTVNGSLTCVYSKPSSTGTKIDTTVTTQTQPDGSKTITKTDNATKTTCSDVNKCTTSTSTTVTTTHQNPAGQTTGSGSTCTGACNSDGTGITPGKGDGTGDGSGDGDCTENCTPGLDGEDSIQKSTQAFYDRVSGSAVAKAVDNIKVSSGGTCYAPTIPLFETSIVLDWHCQIAAQAAPIITIVLKAAWALLAVVVFLSA